MKINNFFFHNFLLKVLSLVLAIATWFYLFDLVNKDSSMQKRETTEDVFARYEFSVKEVPVKPVFTGRSPEGYRVAFDKILIEPAVMNIFGPKDIIDNVEEIKTDRIDLSEYTRSAKLQLGVASDVKFLNLKGRTVDVYLPVEPAAPVKKTVPLAPAESKTN